MDTVYDTGTLSILMLSGEIQAKTITYTLRFRLHVILKTGPPSDKRQASGCLGLGISVFRMWLEETFGYEGPVLYDRL